ncbi:hypothetical protein AWM68_17485 [Fictibacillus phosphorivorans]|uniref:Uncharacterized protein n=1 Tax=Fictibacillus phosphorivorans TaxID=1221500 RepID=A0A165NWL1_9BACL|nr:hypothetical protein [Fictibacillus phosphorivorans]KZE67965.1 hypothetical protein AWM68_17485 [Fictibacillus phosphorivorans]
MLTIKTITYELSPVTVEVKVDESMNEKELLELGKQKVIEQLSKKFPFYKYSITEGPLISDEDLKLGRPVKVKDTGEIGIIYDIKPSQNFPIKVAMPNGVAAAYVKRALEKPSKRTSIEKLIKGRQKWEKDFGWENGKTAFFVNGKEIIPVVISVTRNKIKAIIVSHDTNGSAYSLTERDTHRLFDTLEEAEKSVSK